MWDLWEEKVTGDSETRNWMAINTKPCPKCTKPVEKNGGCNLVVCTCGQASAGMGVPDRGSLLVLSPCLTMCGRCLATLMLLTWSVWIALVEEPCWCCVLQAFCWLCGGATGRAHTWTSIADHSCGRFKDEAEEKVCTPDVA